MLDVLCIGHAAYDVTMSVTRHPQADEKMLADALDLAGGGPAANAAVQVTRLGGRAGFCGYLGRDPFGDMHLAELATEGVDTTLTLRGDAPTAVSQILSKPDGTRSVVNFKEETPWLAADAMHLNEKPKVMLFDGHEPLVSASLLKQAKAAGIMTVLDAGSLHKGTDALALEVDYLLASAKFARQFCHAEDMQQALEQLSAQRNCVIITLGEAGLIWFRDGQTGALSAPEVAVIDSAGAGDAFHGAFALGLARGMAWDALLIFSSAAGALACTRLGARAGLPAASEVTALLQGSTHRAAM